MASPFILPFLLPINKERAISATKSGPADEFPHMPLSFSTHPHPSGSHTHTPHGSSRPLQFLSDLIQCPPPPPPPPSIPSSDSSKPSASPPPRKPGRGPAARRGCHAGACAAPRTLMERINRVSFWLNVADCFNELHTHTDTLLQSFDRSDLKTKKTRPFPLLTLIAFTPKSTLNQSQLLLQLRAGRSCSTGGRSVALSLPPNVEIRAFSEHLRNAARAPAVVPPPLCLNISIHPAEIHLSSSTLSPPSPPPNRGSGGEGAGHAAEQCNNDLLLQQQAEN